MKHEFLVSCIITAILMAIFGMQGAVAVVFAGAGTTFLWLIYESHQENGLVMPLGLGSHVALICLAGVSYAVSFSFAKAACITAAVVFAAIALVAGRIAREYFGGWQSR